MKRVWLNLRLSLPERIRVFAEGFRLHGYEVCHGLTLAPKEGDVLCSWNLIGTAQGAAERFQAQGCRVLVTENATWGNGFAGDRWLTIARDRHNTAGKFPVGGPERWDLLGVELEPWRREGGETVGLTQRGIGPAGTAMPRYWMPPKCDRIRPHPGRNAAKPLAEDLAKASKVVTWGSGAAVQALMWGIRVESHMPGWIAGQDNTDAGRLKMFRALAFAQWRWSEIDNGEALQWLLN